MVKTKTFQFRKPEGHDLCNIQDQNINWDKTECVLKSQRKYIRFLYAVMMTFLISKIGGVRLQQLLIGGWLNSLLASLRKACRKFLQYK